jgi:3(or 17)beta-hydroxysteroid dehydrogenase
MSFEGKVVLVTGGTRGIGEQTTLAFARAGASVVFCGRHRELGEAVEKAVTDIGGTGRYVACDIADESAVITMIRQTVADFGRLDVVVNNAGLSYGEPIETTSLQAWRELLRVNLDGMFLVTKHAIPALRKAKGNIINLGSIFGEGGAPGFTAYAMTKAAAMSFTKSLALELAPDIRVNALCPGATDTPLLAEAWASTGDPEAGRAWVIGQTALGRMGHPAEQAQAALFLASDQASFITGALLMCDGGFSAR